ncbi:MAG: 4Fe-4S dicluster domain-containing protein [candidate division Zixibacteria bacterium]|nr:4Fe-4S dicluster domain-containing protein [candidate division Zixibacteria bacterium]
MPLKISQRTIDEQLRKKVMEISGQNVQQCFQCGTCSGSCPMNEEANLLPRQVMIMIQYGQAEALNQSNMPWICASCHSCVVRCPRGIDIAKVMEALRLIKLRQNIDHVELAKLEPEKIDELPQIAMVSGFRKMTS